MKVMRNIVLVTALAALMASCATVAPGVEESEPLTVCNQITAGESETLVSRSLLPFVFDQEILESDSQLRSLWTGLAKAGYRLDAPQLTEFRPAAAADGALFAPSWEITVYFKNLLAEGDMLARVASSSGEVIMVLRPDKEGARIMAFKEGM